MSKQDNERYAGGNAGVGGGTSVGGGNANSKAVGNAGGKAGNNAGSNANLSPADDKLPLERFADEAKRLNQAGNSAAAPPDEPQYPSTSSPSTSSPSTSSTSRSSNSEKPSPSSPSASLAETDEPYDYEDEPEAVFEAGPMPGVDRSYQADADFIAPNDELPDSELDSQDESAEDYPPASFLRSTPPQASKATFLPPTEGADEPINSSTNEELASLARADRASSRAFSQAPRATRSGRAARSAGLDMTDEYKTRSKFRNSLNQVREQHPYIMERPLTISDDEAADLIDRIRRVPLYKIQDLAMELNSEEVKRLFHCILLISDMQTYRAIQQIASLRASWSLYTVGWSTLQRNFPHRWVQQTLELVYNTLESDPSRSAVRPTYMRRAIGDLVNLGKSDNGFVSDVVRNLNQAYNASPEEGLESFLEDYQILIDTPFGGSVLGEFFKKADLPVLYRKKEILCQSLPFMHPALAAEVISRVIASRDPIVGDKKYIYRQVADSFLHREAQHPMWPYMSADLQRSYNRWYINDRLENQTMMYPGKRDFLMTYVEDIEDVAMLTTDLMAIRFEDFILIDDRRRGDSCIYYDNATVRELLLRGLDEKDLGNPNIPSRDVKDAVQTDRLNGVMRLSFSSGNLHYSREFMDRLLGHRTSQRRENILKNWFK